MKRESIRNHHSRAVLLCAAFIAILISGTAYADTAPSLTIASAPNFGSCGYVQGTTSGIVPADYYIALLIYVPGLGWWSKPYCEPRYSTINSNGTFSIYMCSGGIDYMATIVEAYLFPKISYPACYPVCVAGGVTVPESLVAASVASDRAFRPNQTTIRWSGYDWYTKSSDTGRVGPGINYFAGSTNNVWVDSTDRLHLKIINSGGRWTCAEINSATRMGYGTYRFYLDSRVDNLDKYAVLGLFTWSDHSSPNNGNRELDLEFTTWGDSILPNNAQFVIQPTSGFDENILRYQAPAVEKSTYSITWLPNQVNFFGVIGHHANPSEVYLVKTWQYDDIAQIPETSDERAHLNLWLNNNSGTSNGLPVEVIVSKFEFEPYREKPVYGIDNKALYDPLASAMSGEVNFKTWGRVIGRDSFGITIDDGSNMPVQVREPGHTFSIGDFLTAEGILGSGTPMQLDAATGRIVMTNP